MLLILIAPTTNFDNIILPIQFQQHSHNHHDAEHTEDDTHDAVDDEGHLVSDGFFEFACEEALEHVDTENGEQDAGEKEDLQVDVRAAVGGDAEP